MKARRFFIGALALFAVAIIGSAGAVTYSLPDVAVAPGGNVNTLLRLSNGTDQAAFNITIKYNSSVVDPGTVDFVGSDLSGYLIAQNIIDNAGPNSELRVVVYADPTLPFPTTANVVAVRIPWAVDGVAVAGQSSVLEIATLGVSNATGVSAASVGEIDGLISIAAAPTPGAVTVDPDLNTVNVWNEFFPGSTFSFPANTTGIPTVIAANQATVDPGGPTERESGNVPLNVGTTNNDDDGFTGWNSNAWNIQYVADSVYLVQWTFGGLLGTDPTQNNNLPDFRMRTVDGIGNTFVESVVTGAQPGVFSLPGTSLTGAGERTYLQFFEPGDLSGLTGGPFESRQGLIVEWDLVDFEDSVISAGIDEVASGQVQLNNVTVTRFARADVNPLFTERFDVADFTDSAQFIEGLDFKDFGTGLAFPALGLTPAMNVYDENAYRRPMETPAIVASVGNVTLETELLDSISEVAPLTAGQTAWGFFREVGTPFTAVDNNDETLIWRQVVSANIPAGSDGDATTSPRIRLRTTDQIGHSTEYFVMEVGTKDFPGGPGVGGANQALVARPVPEASGASTYRNYFAYPDNADLSAARDADLDGIQGLIGILDFEADRNSPQFEGTIRFTELKLESAPRSLFVP